MNPEQKNALADVLDDKNVFITGGAGVGKSFLVNEIVEACKKVIGVCAMTGCAAIIINGSTLHSYLGIGIGKDSPEKLAKKLPPTIIKRIKSLEVLLIDEVSMLNEELFDKISDFLQIVKRNKEPFGGTQMVLVGDPFQLCPVEGEYFFKSKNFQGFVTHKLNENMRQRGDPVFKELLDRVRLGVCNDQDFETLESLRHTMFPEGIVPTRLYAKNMSVDSINQTEMYSLENATTDFQCFSNHDVAKKWASTNRVPESVRVCVGAQVMCTKNIPLLGVVNGSRGVVTDIDSGGIYMKLVNGRSVRISPILIPFDNPTIKLRYLPIKLAWALTIHSAQGMTIDALEVDLGKDIFTWGQAYTGLSRATSLKTVKIVNVLSKSFITNPKVIEFMKD